MYIQYMYNIQCKGVTLKNKIRDKIINDKLMYIHHDDKNCPFCRLKLLVKIFGHQSQFKNGNPKFLSRRKRKLLKKTLGTLVIVSPLTP